MVEPRLIAIRNGLLLALAFAAGYIDALSYLGLGRVFTTNMTGNTVLHPLATGELEPAVSEGLCLIRALFSETA